jgi:hypothetical protein
VGDFWGDRSKRLSLPERRFRDMIEEWRTLNGIIDLEIKMQRTHIFNSIRFAQSVMYAFAQFETNEVHVDLMGEMLADRIDNDTDIIGVVFII